MKKLILGAALGVGIGYLIRKVQEEGCWDDLNNDFDKYASKAKKNFKNILDSGKNEADYVKDRVSDTADEINQRLKDRS
ncbi:YtxH domain-containing protein [Apibacter raozihei]|uniref:YtxH domain-containing protein n=1 Tax=Apibacter TaxID=1778601 RepID=UPI000FE37829|nr:MULTISPECIES: YtxH domain-containing protein [Apibacter]